MAVVLNSKEQIAAVPLDQPVTIELPAGVEEEIAVDLDAPKKREPSRRSNSLQDQLEAAQAAQRAERERADRAVQEAQQLAAQAEQARQHASTLEGDVISGGLRAAQGELAAAKSEMVRAGEAGDFTAMAEAQSRVARAQTHIVHLESGAAAAAERQPVRQSQPAQTAQPRPSFAESVNRNPGLMTAEKDWMIAHERNFQNPDFNAKLEFAYQGAMQRGLERGSQAYFDHIERATGLRDGRDYEERDIPMSAPVRRREGGTDGRGAMTGNRVTLTSEQRQFCKDNGIDEIAYAQQVRNMEIDMEQEPAKYGRGR